MKNFSDTTGANVDVSKYGGNSTVWIKPGDILTTPFTALSVSFGDTQWGARAFLRLVLDEDGSGTEFTASFTDKSPAYHQLSAMASEPKNFPFHATVYPQGQSYILGNPTITESSQAAGTTARTASVARNGTAPSASMAGNGSAKQSK